MTDNKDWLDADGRFIFGKHSRESAVFVAQNDPQYLLWIIDEVEDIDPDDREIIEGLLERYAAYLL